MGAPNEARREAKRELRRRVRVLRRARAAVDPVPLDAAVVAQLDRWVDRAIGTAPPRVLTVMVYDAVPGEQDVSAFASLRRERGDRVVAPDADPAAIPPVTPGDVDVVLVPGLAFDRAGRRLGRGGGWYDRFLVGVRPDCLTIGVCDDDQVVDEVPVESHDVRVTAIVTPRGVVTCGHDAG